MSIVPTPQQLINETKSDSQKLLDKYKIIETITDLIKQKWTGHKATISGIYSEIIKKYNKTHQQKINIHTLDNGSVDLVDEALKQFRQKGWYILFVKGTKIGYDAYDDGHDPYWIFSNYKINLLS